MLNTLPAINFFSRNVVLRKKQPGSYINGIWNDGAFTEIQIRGVLQPVSAEDLSILPEGARRSETVVLYTKEEINVSGDEVSTGSDMIDVNGKIYKAIKKYDRTFLGGFYKVIFEFLPES